MQGISEGVVFLTLNQRFFFLLKWGSLKITQKTVHNDDKTIYFQNWLTISAHK
jgi:hypothetical protein